MPLSEVRSALGIASINVSTPRCSHGDGSISCRQVAMVVLPELDPPFSMITWITVAPPKPGLVSLGTPTP